MIGAKISAIIIVDALMATSRGDNFHGFIGEMEEKSLNSNWGVCALMSDSRPRGTFHNKVGEEVDNESHYEKN